MIKALSIGTAMALATPAMAQSVPAAPPAAAPVDSAKLQTATRIAGKLLPDGTYRKMMSGTLDKVLAGMTDQITDVPVRSLAEMGGLAPEKVKALGPATLRQMMAILDPAFDQRMKLTMNVIMGDMVDLMTTMEPSVRQGMAEAYASRFSTTQLAEIERFFATPTGSAYAEQSMLIFTDPALVSRMQAMIPQMMQAMPAIMKKVSEATAALPKPKKPHDLTQAELKELAEMLGVNEGDLKPNDD